MTKNKVQNSSLKGRILIVDDTALNRKKMTMAVQNLGHQSGAVNDGIEALEALKRDNYDVILLDIEMPNMDGFEVLARLQNDEILRHIPVIVVSALEDMDDIISAIKLGAVDFLPKNFNAVLLEARVDSCMEKKRHRDKEIETLNEVRRLTSAASELDRDDFNPKKSGIQDIAVRADDLGHLALVLLNKSIEVYNRQLSQKQQIKTLVGTLLLLLMGVCFGLKPALAKLSITNDINPLGIALYTISFTAIFTAVFALTKRCNWPPFTWSSLTYYIAWGILGVLIPQILLFWVADQIPGVMIAIILTLEAFITLFISASIKLEKITIRRFIGLTLGVSAMLIILLPSVTNTTRGGEYIWYLAAMCIPLCFALRGILVSSMKSEETDPVASAAVGYGIAAILMFIIVWNTDSFTSFGYPFGKFELAIITFGIVEAVGVIALIVLIRSTGSVFASQKGYTVAAGGIMWSIMLLDETLSTSSVFGFFLAVIGIYLVAQQSKKEDLLRPHLDQPRASARS